MSTTTASRPRWRPTPVPELRPTDAFEVENAACPRCDALVWFLPAHGNVMCLNCSPIAIRLTALINKAREG